MKANGAPETYPIQFRDKIDEYLWKEHHILGGCCSSIESMKYAVAREVAEKLTDAFIDQACEWLSNIPLEDMEYKYDNFDTSEGWYKMIEDFKNYMKKMSKVLQCPHFISYGGITGGCLLGYFPANCESCTCPDKHYIEITTTTSTTFKED